VNLKPHFSAILQHVTFRTTALNKLQQLHIFANFSCGMLCISLRQIRNFHQVSLECETVLTEKLGC